MVWPLNFKDGLLEAHRVWVAAHEKQGLLRSDCSQTFDYGNSLFFTLDVFLPCEKEWHKLFNSHCFS